MRLRKPHPCGGYDWQVTRLGADIGLRCLTCGRRVMLERADAREAHEGVRQPRQRQPSEGDAGACRETTRRNRRAATASCSSSGSSSWRTTRSGAYWFMRLASHGATNALAYSLLVLTVRQSDSAIATGFLLLTLIIPSAMLGAIAGVAVDRMPRGLIMFVCNVLRALSCVCC